MWGGDPLCPHSWGDEGASTQRQRNGPKGGLHDGRASNKLADNVMLHPSTGGFCALCGAWRGSLGLEPDYRMFVEHIVEVFRAVRRVLRKDGTCWLNLGDSYAGSWGNQGRKEERGTQRPINGGMLTPVHDGRYPANESNTGAIRSPGLKPKDLVMIPARVAIALQDDGWWLRSDIIWHKLNPMPESTTDRPTTAHEHVFLLAKAERYFYDAEAIKEDAAYPDGPNAPDAIKSPYGQGFARRAKGNAKTFRGGVYTQGQAFDNSAPMERDSHGNAPNPTMKRNKRSVWSIATSPYSAAHFATFPPALVEPCILAGTSERGCCAKCGAPWERVVETNNPSKHAADHANALGWANTHSKTSNPQSSKSLHRQPGGVYSTAVSKGWRPTCRCGVAETAPCTVLDPFFGAGTTGLVADRLGRDCIGIELNPAYARMAEDRLRGDAGLFADIAAE